MTSASDAGSMRPPAPRRGTGGPCCSGATPATFKLELDINSRSLQTSILIRATHSSTRDGLALVLFAPVSEALEVLAEVSVPRRDDDGDSAVRAGLTRKAYE